MSTLTSVPADNPFPSLFVDTAWLAEHLQDEGLRILQIGGEKYYPQFHIPGALLLSYGDLVCQRDGVPAMRPESDYLCERFGQLGINRENPVLIYDTAGGADAARALWTLATLGHPALAVLDGGLGVWYRENRPMTGQMSPRQATLYFAAPNPQWQAEERDVLDAAKEDATVCLLDTRSVQEYQGQTSRPPHGHIAGARLFQWMDSLHSQFDPRLQERERLLRLLAQVGLQDPQQEIITYCETGHRASHTWLLLRYLGFTHVRLYDGSIAEWRLLNHPVVAGSQPR
ncbi:sulfurtransferase [Candidatus Magnetaquicoccus inordinatus]|uniref:sulfurtransferase n=1 Tax=Candidatus Magnetaquicoccus inordinatus TaxID=2496818 RepID=UPI00102BAD04|nr:sulfurtransferase [Candidatus Magnetaquicoccus inordinatus]